MRRTLLVLAPIAFLAAAAMAQEPKSDGDYIKAALSAAPPAIAKDAAVVRMAGDGTMHTLRKGSNGFTCLIMGTDKMCNDRSCRTFIALAAARMQYERDWSGTAAEWKVADLDANNMLAEQFRGHLSAASGRMSDALVHFHRAVDGDPLNLLYRKYLARALHYARRTAEAEAVLRESISLDTVPGLHYQLGRTLLLRATPRRAARLTRSRTPRGDASASRWATSPIIGRRRHRPPCRTC